MNQTCRACHGADLTDVLDLGAHKLSDFRMDDSSPPAYRLRLRLCRTCGLAQLADTAPRGLLYHDGYGFYSGVNEGIRRDLADVVRTALHYVPGASNWLDIASNDGTLLSYVPNMIYRVAVDPVAKFSPLAARFADRVVTGYFERSDHAEQYDVVTSISMFYDVDDLDTFVSGVAEVLAPGGVWVIQQNSALEMLRQTAVDNICSEHLTYFSLRPLRRLLARHGLEVVDASTSAVNGGSLRTVVAHVGAHLANRAGVANQLLAEAEAGLGAPQTWLTFAKRARQRLDTLGAYVRDLTARGRRVAIYGASTRGATLWQGADLGPDELVYAVERNPDKVGRRYSAIGIPIISEEAAREDHPDLMLVGPWWFADQIIKRERAYLEAGGRLVIPLGGEVGLWVVTRDDLTLEGVDRG